MEKLAVAPPTETTNEASSPNRQTRERDAFDAREERDACEKNAMHRFSNLARDDANDTRTRIANVHRDASVPAVAAHRRGSLAHVVSRRGSVRDLAGFPTHRRGSVRNRRGSVARLPGDDDEDEPRGRFGSLENARENVSRVGARTSSPKRAVRVETQSVWVAPGQFVSMRVEVPRGAHDAQERARAAVASVARTFTRRRRKRRTSTLRVYTQNTPERGSRERLGGLRRSASFVHVRPSRRTRGARAGQAPARECVHTAVSARFLSRAYARRARDGFFSSSRDDRSTVPVRMCTIAT